MPLAISYWKMSAVFVVVEIWLAWILLSRIFIYGKPPQRSCMLQTSLRCTDEILILCLNFWIRFILNLTNLSSISPFFLSIWRVGSVFHYCLLFSISFQNPAFFMPNSSSPDVWYWKCCSILHWHQVRQFPHDVLNCADPEARRKVPFAFYLRNIISSFDFGSSKIYDKPKL